MYFCFAHFANSKEVKKYTNDLAQLVAGGRQVLFDLRMIARSVKLA